MRNIESTREALTYQPRDPRALQAIGQAVEPVTRRIEQARNFLGGAALDKTGSPALATGAYMLPDIALTLLGARGAGIKGPTMAQMAERSRGPAMGGPRAQDGVIGAWHGSPHDFDRFDMSKLGTGEGAQVYGHGLYFAGNKEVANAYRKNLSGPRDDFDGSIAPELMQAIRAEGYLGFDSAGEVVSAIRNTPDWASRWEVEDPARLAAAFEAHEAKKFGGQGRVYDVELAPDEDDLLDWDAPLSEQPSKVRKALADMAALDSTVDVSDALTGEQFYRRLQRRFAGGVDAGGQGASEHLGWHGIPGLRYLDAGSRDGGSGTRNYVMFDDKLIKIRGRE